MRVRSFLPGAPENFTIESRKWRPFLASRQVKWMDEQNKARAQLDRMIGEKFGSGDAKLWWDGAGATLERVVIIVDDANKSMPFCCEIIDHAPYYIKENGLGT